MVKPFVSHTALLCCITTVIAGDCRHEQASKTTDNDKTGETKTGDTKKGNDDEDDDDDDDEYDDGDLMQLDSPKA